MFDQTQGQTKEDKNFQGRTIIFDALAKKLCPRIKIFRGTKIFLTELRVYKEKVWVTWVATLEVSYKGLYSQSIIMQDFVNMYVKGTYKVSVPYSAKFYWGKF